MLMLLSLLLPVALIGVVGGDDDDDGVNRIEGTDGNDTIDGGDGSDFIRGLDGDDEMTGGAGADTLLGFEGSDVLIGNGGDDMLCSGDGDDFVSGNRGIDTIEGQDGNDWIDAGYSSDQAFGDAGEDTVIGGRGSDVVNGGADNDVIFGGILQGVPLEEDELLDLASGASLADVLGTQDLEIDLREDDRMDTLRGGQGDDQIFVGNGDMATGGGNADTFHLMFDDVNEPDNLAQITDYTPDEDSLTVIFDAPLEVTEVTIEDRGDDAVVVANGQPLAVVSGAAGTLSAEDVSILTEDSIVSLFDPNAGDTAAPAA